MELIASRPGAAPRNTSSAHAELIQVQSTRPREFIDITDQIQALVLRSATGVGFINLQVLHTTAALVLNEHEPLLLGDFGRTLETIASPAQTYQHDDFTRRHDVAIDERTNGHAHCQALLLSAAACLNIVDGRLVLGRWQRLFMVELDGPQARTLSAVVVGYPSRAARVNTRVSATEVRFREALR
jgi:secondary thiamine-phosphate synthase enzyme